MLLTEYYIGLRNISEFLSQITDCRILASTVFQEAGIEPNMSDTCTVFCFTVSVHTVTSSDVTHSGYFPFHWKSAVPGVNVQAFSQEAYKQLKVSPRYEGILNITVVLFHSFGQSLKLLTLQLQSHLTK